MFGRLFRLWSAVHNDVCLLWFTLHHPDKPWWLVPAALLLAGYVISPVDLISDIIPVIGWMDGIALVPFMLHMLLRGLPDRVCEDARFAAARRVKPPGRQRLDL